MGNGIRRLLTVALVTVATAASGKTTRPTLRLRDVTVERGVRLDEATVRSTLGEELDAAASAASCAGKARKHDAAVLSFVVRERSSRSSEIAVSAVVSDARGGAVLGVLSGSAQMPLATYGSSASSADTERFLLRTAAHSALANLPGLLR
jgi:hypothetical protein